MRKNRENEKRKLRDDLADYKRARMEVRWGGAGDDVDLDTFRRRKAEIPIDCRDLTGVLLGDPLPGRSALCWRNPYGMGGGYELGSRRVQ